MNLKITLIAPLLLLLSCSAMAGKVVVRKSSEAFDAFAVRDRVLREHEWREALRLQRQFKILQALPIGCLTVARPFRHYSCAGVFYRPYQFEDSEYYIQIDPVTDKAPATGPE